MMSCCEDAVASGDTERTRGYAALFCSLLFHAVLLVLPLQQLPVTHGPFSIDSQMGVRIPSVLAVRLQVEKKRLPSPDPSLTGDSVAPPQRERSFVLTAPKSETLQIKAPEQVPKQGLAQTGQNLPPMPPMPSVPRTPTEFVSPPSGAEQSFSPVLPASPSAIAGSGVEVLLGLDASGQVNYIRWNRLPALTDEQLGKVEAILRARNYMPGTSGRTITDRIDVLNLLGLAPSHSD